MSSKANSLVFELSSKLLPESNNSQLLGRNQQDGFVRSSTAMESYTNIASPAKLTSKRSEVSLKLSASKVKEQIPKDTISILGKLNIDES